MSMTKRLALPAMMMTTLALSISSAHAETAQDALPAPVEALMEQDLQLHSTFDLEDGLTGYAMSHNGNPVPVYVLPGNERAIIGTLIDATGMPVMDEAMSSAVHEETNALAWSLLQDAEIVVEGDPDAPNMMYTISDPNCGFCNRQWHAVEPLVEAGTLQVHHLMVGLQGPSSIAKAAAILEAEDPAAELGKHFSRFDLGGIAGIEGEEATLATLDENRAIMQKAGVTGTPASFYQDADGTIQRISGALPLEDMKARLGIE
ncbi:thiol:disulfide interchange protein DsbG [Vreelandella rituensis]|uniref:Thiol:disulfide interchange protein n=1 Tax=Vreelandella rituensis TaxID=2282306 RepID=A0A368UBU7_9GAMM|nr:thiol:disulfide interchange protein DsbG [Halomonas rituensis]RCV93912.1 thiol:disulfide interchange protein DsbG [Halomonas rituensis]